MDAFLHPSEVPRSNKAPALGHEVIPKIDVRGMPWFDKLTTNGSNPLVLSLSKDATRTSWSFGTGACIERKVSRESIRISAGRITNV
jgi:hypothetical protein